MTGTLKSPTRRTEKPAVTCASIGANKGVHMIRRHLGHIPADAGSSPKSSSTSTFANHTDGIRPAGIGPSEMVRDRSVTRRRRLAFAAVLVRVVAVPLLVVGGLAYATLAAGPKTMRFTTVPPGAAAGDPLPAGVVCPPGTYFLAGRYSCVTDPLDTFGQPPAPLAQQP